MKGIEKLSFKYFCALSRTVHFEKLFSTSRLIVDKKKTDYIPKQMKDFSFLSQKCKYIINCIFRIYFLINIKKY